MSRSDSQNPIKSRKQGESHLQYKSRVKREQALSSQSVTEPVSRQDSSRQAPIRRGTGVFSENHGNASLANNPEPNHLQNDAILPSSRQPDLGESIEASSNRPSSTISREEFAKMPIRRITAPTPDNTMSKMLKGLFSARRGALMGIEPPTFGSVLHAKAHGKRNTGKSIFSDFAGEDWGRILFPDSTHTIGWRYYPPVDGKEDPKDGHWEYTPDNKDDEGQYPSGILPYEWDLWWFNEWEEADDQEKPEKKKYQFRVDGEVKSVENREDLRNQLIYNGVACWCDVKIEGFEAALVDGKGNLLGSAKAFSDYLKENLEAQMEDISEYIKDKAIKKIDNGFIRRWRKKFKKLKSCISGFFAHCAGIFNKSDFFIQWCCLDIRFTFDVKVTKYYCVYTDGEPAQIQELSYREEIVTNEDYVYEQADTDSQGVALAGALMSIIATLFSNMDGFDVLLADNPFLKDVGIFDSLEEAVESLQGLLHDILYGAENEAGILEDHEEDAKGIAEEHCLGSFVVTKE